MNPKIMPDLTKISESQLFIAYQMFKHNFSKFMNEQFYQFGQKPHPMEFF